MLYRFLLAAMVSSVLTAQPSVQGTPSQSVELAQQPASVSENPLEPPAELQTFVRRVSLMGVSQQQKLQAVLSAFFRSAEDGGLGITYDNSHTRTLKEVWRDRKANCLSLTSLLVAACNSLSIPVSYAEPINTAHWRRVGSLIKYERHVVAMMRVPPLVDLVADFLPRLRNRETRYIVNILSEERVRALWAANRAAECMDEMDYAQSEAFALKAVQADPACAVGWNTLGVLRGLQSDTTAAEVCYRKAMAIDPMDGTAVGNLEMLLRKIGRWEESIEYRRLGLELRRRDPYFHAFLANEAFEAGDLDEALKALRIAIKLQPQDSDMYLLEAQIKLRQGKPADAEKSLETARRYADPKERERYDSKLASLRQSNS